MYTCYMLQNNVNMKKYVGITRNLNKRMRGHIAMSKKGPWAIHRAIRKYGTNGFTVSQLAHSETIDEIFEIEMLQIVRQKSHISFHGYNMTDGGDGIKGYAHSDKTKKKISNSLSYGNNPIATPIIVDGLPYDSQSRAAEHLEISATMLRNRLLSSAYPNYQFLN